MRISAHSWQSHLQHPVNYRKPNRGLQELRNYWCNAHCTATHGGMLWETTPQLYLTTYFQKHLVPEKLWECKFLTADLNETGTTSDNDPPGTEQYLELILSANSELNYEITSPIIAAWMKHGINDRLKWIYYSLVCSVVAKYDSATKGNACCLAVSETKLLCWISAATCCRHSQNKDIRDLSW